MLIRMLGRTACAAAVLASAVATVHADEPVFVNSQYSEPVFVNASQSADDGVAQVRNIGLCRDACGPGGPGNPNGCGPQAMGPACGPNGMCRDGRCQPGGGYVNGGYCPNGARHCPPGADCYAGKPYTFGDLACDMGWCKSHYDEMNPLSCHNLHNAYQGSSLQSWWCQEKMKYHCRNQYRNQVWGAHFHNKFNYFAPSGNGGKGAPFFGCYNRVIAASPGYYDARDSQIYASPMTGVPTAVPLAPNVRHQYNYSWGTPSSRLTPISTIVPPQ